MEFTKQEEELQQPYAYWLETTRGIGNAARYELAVHAGSPKGVYEMGEKDLSGLIPEHKIKKLAESKRKRVPIEEYKMLKKKGIHFYPIYHSLYPKRLKNIADSPFGIFVEGKLPEEDIPSVAVIGARQCSEYGRYMADKCGRELAEEGINVISGMARGIDGISQKAAMEAGGKSYSVLGCGTNICYPQENRHIYVSAKQMGGIISEYPPDTVPAPGLFPPRNRIISGLSDVVLIIEARLKSGTLITADMALEQGKEVYVVPGRVTDSLSEGCNRLIGQGAGIFTSVEEMLDETGLCRMQEKRGNAGKDKERVMTEKNEGVEEKVLKSLDFYPKNVDEIMKETKMEYRKLINILTRMCMEGKAQKVSAGQFIKNNINGKK